MASAGQLSAADVCVPMVVPLTGNVLVTHAGTTGRGAGAGGGSGGTAAVVKDVLLVEPQPVAGPVAFLGTTYQLYTVEAVKPPTI